MKAVAKKRSTGRKKYSAGKHCVDKKKRDDSSADEQKGLPGANTLASWVAGMRAKNEKRPKGTLGGWANCG